MSKILKRSSFGLLRTNPKLTTNIKIIADTKNKVYLESIDADPLLSKSIYKGFEVSGNGLYSFDLKRFYSQNNNTLPVNIAYKVFEEDASLEIKNRYHKQYDLTYCLGAEPKNSRLYTEEFSMFAPLWLEQENLPDYFVIFKMDGPVTFNSNYLTNPEISPTANIDQDLENLITDPSLFFKNYIQKAKIIKTYDLTNQTAIGNYIRNHVNSTGFPEASLYASLDKGAATTRNGISYFEGGFCKKSQDIYLDYSLIDKTIIESEDFITNGFKSNGVVLANILNLEFLFDDASDKYEINRYFGLYVNKIELGKFILDQNRLFKDRDIETTQIPKPVINNIGAPNNTNSQIQLNTKGIKIYPNLGASGIYSGRLLTWSETQNSRFGYVSDKLGNLYSVDNVNNWVSQYSLPFGSTATPLYEIDEDFLRIKNTQVDRQNFTGFNKPFLYIPVEATDKIGRPAISIKIIADLTSGDEIRIKYVDYSDITNTNVDTHTIKSDASLSPGISNGLLFSSNGTKKQIAKALSNSINFIQNYTGEYEMFYSVAIDDSVIIYSRSESEVYNKIAITLFSEAITFPFEITDQYIDPDVGYYKKSPIASTSLTLGKILTTKLSSGNNNAKSRAIINKEDVLELRDNEDLIFVKTKTGYTTTQDYGLYLDKPVYNDQGDIINFIDIDKYVVINLSDTKQSFDFSNSKKLALYKYAKNSVGYLSVLPVKNFDFDFHNTDYMKNADSDTTSLYNWYKSGVAGVTTINQPLFNRADCGATTQAYIEQLLGPTTQIFITNGGFAKCSGYIDELIDQEEAIINEYDRLKENDQSALALSSRVVPFINKWVYDDLSTDTRENGYRLNVDQTFGFSNFSPSFEEVNKNPNFFTHEWYYLQKYPPYMTFREKVDSFSYFDEDINLPNMPYFIGEAPNLYAGLTGGTGNLLSCVEDYFLSYFTRESVDGLAIERDFKYSIFSEASTIKPAETLFRGVKVEIKDRSEYSNINFNKNSLRYLFNTKYNSYKFSAVLTYGTAGTQMTFVKNDKRKCVTLIIQANLDDPIFKYTIDSTEHNFIDRSLLYCASDQFILGGTGLEYSNKSLSGLITGWSDDGTQFNVTGSSDSNGNFTNFIGELTLNSNGSYNNISIVGATYTYTFNNIFNVKANIFSCKSISGLPGGYSSPMFPDSSQSYDNIYSSWGFLGPDYAEPFTFNPRSIGGGFGAYSTILNEISFAFISDAVNSGNPEIKYINVNEIGVVKFNTFTVDFIRPDYLFKSSYLKAKSLDKLPQSTLSSNQVTGYELTNTGRVSISQIARYKGNYNPRVKDVLKFVDTDDLKQEGLSYYNIQLFDKFEHITNPNLGIIDNVYFNKINTENTSIISRPNFTSIVRKVSPTIGDIAISKRDLFIFKSNRDVSYYNKFLNKTDNIKIIGTREPREEKAYFGSKIISLPNSIKIETSDYPAILDSDVLIAGGIDNVPNGIVKQTTNFINKNELKLDIYISKLLTEWLIKDGISVQFEKYINPEFSFGNQDLEDDIKLYIKENILQRYIVEKITLWQKFYKKTKNITAPVLIETSLTDLQKAANSYTETKDFRSAEMIYGSLDQNIIYNLPLAQNVSLAISIQLIKK